MSKYTPGPWLLNEDDAIVYVVAGDEEPAICTTQNARIASLSFEKAVANARLIAAAPELLSVLKKTYSLIDSVAFISTEGDTIELMKEIRAVINKAT